MNLWSGQEEEKGTRVPASVSHNACSSCGFLTICYAYHLWFLHPLQREERGQADTGLALVRLYEESLHTLSSERRVVKVCPEAV